MRIIYGDHQEPMIMDTVDGLANIRTGLIDFILSQRTEYLIPADPNPKAWPQLKDLIGIRMTKGQGPLLASISADKYLDVTGSTENLTLFTDLFAFDGSATDGDHHHVEYIVPRGGAISPHTCSPMIEIYDEEEEYT
jgi:hypothetical protein